MMVEIDILRCEGYGPRGLFDMKDGIIDVLFAKLGWRLHIKQFDY